MTTLTTAMVLHAPPTPRDRDRGSGSGSDTGQRGRSKPSLGRFAPVVVVLILTLMVVVGPTGTVAAGREDVYGWLLGSAAGEWLVGAVGIQTLGNLLLFVPVTAAAMWCAPLRRLPLTATVMLVLPLLVEAVQAVLPGRVPDGMDVVHNTTGVVVCLAVSLLVRCSVRAALGRRSSRERSR